MCISTWENREEVCLELCYHCCNPDFYLLQPVGGKKMCELLEASLVDALLGYFRKRKWFAHQPLESLITYSLESEEFSACALFLSEGMKLNCGWCL